MLHEAGILTRNGCNWLVKVKITQGGKLTIRHNEASQAGVVDGLNGLSAQDTVGDNSVHGLGTVRADGFSSLGELYGRLELEMVESCLFRGTYSSASVCHVIDENGNLVPDITNKNHASNHVGARALLVNEGKGRVETISNRGGSLRTAGIGRNDDTVLNVQVLADPAQD